MVDKIILRKIVNRIPRKLLKIPYTIFYCIVDRKEIFRNYKLLDEGIAGISADDSKENINQLRRCLKSYSLYMNRAGADRYLQSYFFSSDFKLVKANAVGIINPNDVILICCVKNDLTRIKYVYEWHKKIGVKHFAFLDNGSTDGTFDYLMQLEDIDLFQTHDKYHAGAKAAWTRKIQNYYGFNRWYLIVDSDELFSYVGMETHSIHDLIEYAEKRHIKRVWSILLDMYAKGQLYKDDCSQNKSLIDEYSYFDTESYYMRKDYKGVIIHGGPRSRLINHFETPLSKLPLIYAEYADFWADHTPMPFDKNFNTECLGVLRHYKFLPEDKDKYIKIAQDGNYVGGSYDYKQYVKMMDDEKSSTFWYEKSCKYSNSSSFLNIPFLKAPFKD
ncbi:MAG: glycosyltransferase family 2 protein [Prevotella sp.]|nr:glycosyltransferase family 2 protein [Prevotella sp.]